jgi:hypothetical protein
MGANGQGSGSSRGSRFAAGLPAVLHLHKNDYECVAYNLSRTGALLVGRFPRLVGYRVEATFRYPQGDLSVRLAGRAVRADHDHDENEDHLALEFMEIDDARRDDLEVLLARVIEGYSPAPIEGLRPGAPVHEVRKALEQVPLPHRISLATRATPREREFLCQDTHPQVLEALVRNPNLRLDEARSIAEMPHLQPSTLELLSRDPRWTNDEAVRCAIVAHPKTPLVLAQRIVDKLKPPTIKKLIQKPGVPPAIRTQLQRKLVRR